MSFNVNDRINYTWQNKEGPSYTSGTIVQIFNNGKILVAWDDKTTTLTTEVFLKKNTQRMGK